MNILILLHGLGDTHVPFKTFGERLALPETACISLQASTPLPFDLGGYHWGDDIAFDNSNGQMEVDTGFVKSTRLILDNLIKDTLITNCGFKPREILMFGFGQGGVAAVSAASQLSSKDPEELGGVVAIGGFLALSTRLTPAEKQKTPILLCKGNRKSGVSSNDVARTKETFAHVQVVEWNKDGDAMPASREEMLPIMQFFARRLRSMAGVPVDAVEMT